MLFTESGEGESDLLISGDLGLRGHIGASGATSGKTGKYKSGVHGIRGQWSDSALTGEGLVPPWLGN